MFNEVAKALWGLLFAEFFQEVQAPFQGHGPRPEPIRYTVISFDVVFRHGLKLSKEYIIVN